MRLVFSRLALMRLLWWLRRIGVIVVIVVVRVPLRIVRMVRIVLAAVRIFGMLGRLRRAIFGMRVHIAWPVCVVIRRSVGARAGRTIRLHIVRPATSAGCVRCHNAFALEHARMRRGGHRRTPMIL